LAYDFVVVLSLSSLIYPFFYNSAQTINSDESTSDDESLIIASQPVKGSKKVNFRSVKAKAKNKKDIADHLREATEEYSFEFQNRAILNVNSQLAELINSTNPARSSTPCVAPTNNMSDMSELYLDPTADSVASRQPETEISFSQNDQPPSSHFNQPT